MPKEESKNASQKNDAASHTPSVHEEVSAPAENRETPSVAHGSLNNALMRTFRSDISSVIQDEKKADAAARSLIPKKKPATLENEKVVPSSTPTEKAKESERVRNKAIVHTFKDDVQHMVRSRKMSLSRMAALESARNAQNNPDAQSASSPWRTTMLVVLGILFVLAGILIAVGAYYAYVLNTAPPEQMLDDPAMFFTEARERINVTELQSYEVMPLLAGVRRETRAALGAIVEFYITREADTFGESGESTRATQLNPAVFLEAFGASVDSTFFNTLGNEYLLGVHLIDDGTIPFLVLTSASHGHTFAGMLAWETAIEEDLAPFFSPRGVYVRPAIAGGARFEDTTIENLDIRFIRDENGQTRLLYAFVNRTTVVITTNLRTLLELAARIRVAPA